MRAVPSSPPTQRISNWRANGGICARRSTTGQSSGGGASGIADSDHSGSPSRQIEHVPSASATGAPSCSIRRLTFDAERPARSTVALTSTGPATGGATKCTVSERGRRAGSSTAATIARVRIVET